FGGGLPWNMVAYGAGIGVAIIAVDEWLKRSGSTWRAPVLAVAVGIYLPLELSVPILIGGLIAHAASRARALRGVADAGAQHGMLFAAGLITGEALIGIFMAIPIVLANDPDVIALGWSWPTAVGIIVIGVIAAALYRVAAQAR